MTGVVTRTCEDGSTGKTVTDDTGHNWRGADAAQTARDRRPLGARETQATVQAQGLRGSWLHWYLDLGPQASRPVTEQISIALSHPVCGNLLQQAQETSIMTLLPYKC